MKKYEKQEKALILVSSGFKEESCFDAPFYVSEDLSYKDYPLEHVVDLNYFRTYFYHQGKVV